MCQPNEVTAFSCKLNNGKIASFCASQDFDKSNGYAYYAYGKNQSTIELKYPPKQEYSHKAFSSYVQPHYLKKYHVLDFRTNEYSYGLILTKNVNASSWKKDKLTVYENVRFGGKEATWTCKSKPIKNNLDYYTGLFFDNILE